MDRTDTTEAHWVACHGSVAAVWRLPAGAQREAQVLVGRALFEALHQAAPNLLARVRAGFDEGADAVTFEGPSGRFICQLQAAEPDQLGAAGPVVITTFQPLAETHAHPDGGPVKQDRPAAQPVEELGELMEHAPAAIAVLRLKDGTLYYKAVNRAFELLVGRCDLLGRAFGSLLQGEGNINGGLHAYLLDVAHSGVRKQLQDAPVTLDWRHDGTVQTKFLDLVLQPLPATGAAEAGVSLFAYDVTAQVLAKREAEAREHYFRRLADSLPQVVWTSDHTGAISWLNAQWFAMTGRTPEDEHAKEFLSVVHPQDQQAAQAGWADALAHCVPFSSEMRLRMLDGSYRWFLVQSRPQKDEQTGLLRWFGSSTDVHEQKSISQAMADLLGNMNDGFFVIDGNWIIRHVNDRHLVLTGIPRDQQLGKSLQDVYFPKPEDKDSVYLRNCRRALKERISMTFEEYYEPLNMWTAVSLYPTGKDGLAILYKNLTAERLLQKNIEVEKQKFEAVFLDSPAGMALLRGPELIFEKANKRYIEIVGQRDVVGKSLMEALPEMKGQPFAQLMLEVFQTGVPFEAHGMAAELLDATTGAMRRAYFDFTYARILDIMGNPYGVYLHAIDVTDKVEASQRADALALRLTEAIEARDEFLSSASHELKTPVTSIKMQLQMTRRRVNPAEGKVPDAEKLAKTLDICGKQVDRMAALIEDLLDVSRIAAGKMTFTHALVDIGAMVRDVAEQFAPAFDAAGCTVEVAVEQTSMLSCDAFRIEQVVVNLVTNAIKYGAGSRIGIRVLGRQEGGVCIEVADGGMGISEAGQARIFERFERAVTHQNVSGLGLGLFICKQIVLAHGGDITVASQLGQGSTFTVDLPYHQAP